MKNKKILVIILIIVLSIATLSAIITFVKNNNSSDVLLSNEFISAERQTYHCPGDGMPYQECYCECLDKSKNSKLNYETCIKKNMCDRIN